MFSLLTNVAKLKLWTRTSWFVWKRVSPRLAEGSRESLCNQTLKLFFRLRNTDRPAQCVLHESHSPACPSLPASSATWLDASLYPVSDVESVSRAKREEERRKEGKKRFRFAATAAAALQSWSHLRVAARWQRLIRSALRMSHSVVLGNTRFPEKPFSTMGWTTKKSESEGNKPLSGSRFFVFTYPSFCLSDKKVPPILI